MNKICITSDSKRKFAILARKFVKKKKGARGMYTFFESKLVGLFSLFRIGNSDASCSSTGLLGSSKNTDSDALINPDDESDDDQGAGYNQASDSGYNVNKNFEVL